MKSLVIIILLQIFSTITKSQTVGGNSAFSFINQSNTVQISALGGVNISNIGNDVGLSFSNPALLRNEMHQQLNTSFNNFLAGIKNYSLTTGFHLAKANTNSLEPLNDTSTIPELMEFLQVSKNKVNPILKKLFNLGVYGKFEFVDAEKGYTKYWLLNPYLSFSNTFAPIVLFTKVPYVMNEYTLFILLFILF